MAWNDYFQAEWKSDNYGIKETTSIQTGKSADVEWAHPTSAPLLQVWMDTVSLIP